jgi:hypothetical protein
MAVEILVNGDGDQWQEGAGDDEDDPKTKEAAELGRRGRVF